MTVKTILDKKIIFYIAIFIIIPAMAFTSQKGDNSSNFGVLSILPPFIAIFLAFLTRNVMISLFLGVFVGTYLLSLKEFNFIISIVIAYVKFCKIALNNLADPWNAGIILQCLAIGGLIALITKTGGTEAIAKSLSRLAKTPASSQIITWLMGLIIFFDDYANSLIVGPIMRPLTDRMKVSREKLAFIIDSTAAPVAGIALISTWVAYEIGLINDAFKTIGVPVNAYTIFVETIPYRFYNILILAFVFFTAITKREFGPMYKAEIRAKKENKPIADGAKPMISDEAINIIPKEGVKSNIWDALIPLSVLIIAAFSGFYLDGYFKISGGKDLNQINIIQSAPWSLKSIWLAFGASDAAVVLFQAALLAGIVAFIMAILKKQMEVSEAVNIWLTGLKSLIITAVILMLAWSLSSVMKELGTAKYLVSILSDKMSAFILPATIFFFGSIISFATGTSYGTMGILMPLTIPLAYAINPDHLYIIINISSVLTGAIFGDHCSPISDTTILSSMGSACDHIDHTRTQLTYAIFIAIISILFGYIPAGSGMNILLILPFCLVLTFVLLRLIGKSTNI